MEFLELNDVTVDENNLCSDLERLVKLVKPAWKQFTVKHKVIHSKLTSGVKS